MSKTAKIVVAVVGAFVIIAVGFGFVAWRFVSNSFTTDPVEAAAIGQQVLEHELPTGYEPEFGTDVLGFKVMAAFDTFGTESMIMLMSIPEGGTEAELRAASREELSNQRGSNVDFEYVDTREITVRGQTVNLDRYAGAENGVEVIQELAIFEARDGRPGVLMLIADAAVYDETGFDQFLKSVE